jgi:thymidylate synthase (FAD)
MPNEIVAPAVELVAYTVFTGAPSLWGEYEPEMQTYASGAQHVAEFAGRACYQSWSKPNPATATNEGYLAHILDVGHGSVLEHGSLTFYLTGVSRSLTHELVRHRAGMAFSQLSQRYVDSREAGIVVPPEMRGDLLAETLIKQAMEASVSAYESLVAIMTAKLEEEGVQGTEARKRARQAARCVMPNMTETKIVVTGNLRSWRHILTMRAAAAADHEIREVAMLIYDELARYVPNAVQDFNPVTLHDGTRALEKT